MADIPRQSDISQMIQAMMEMINSRAEKLGAKMDANTEKMKAHAEKLEAHAAKLDAQTAKINGNMAKMDANTARMKAHTEKMNAQEVKMDGQEETMEAHTKKMDGQVDQMKTELGTNSKDFGARLNVAENEVGANVGRSLDAGGIALQEDLQPRKKEFLSQASEKDPVQMISRDITTSYTFSTSNDCEMSCSVRIKIKPSEYDGQTSWSTYKTQFEIIAKAMGWSDVEKACSLAAALRPPAVEMLKIIPEEKRLHYNSLVEALEFRYGKIPQYYINQLKNRIQGSGETLQELAGDIKILVCLGFPNFPAEIQDQVAQQHFVEAIADPENQFSVMMADCKTLQGALNHAMKYECAIKARRISRDIRDTGSWTNIRDIANVSKTEELANIKVVENNSQTDMLIKTCQTLVEKSSRYPENIKCWNCSEIGHLRKDCKNKRKAKQTKIQRIGLVWSRKKRMKIVCWRCGKIGHLQRTCENTSKLDSTAKSQRVSRGTDGQVSVQHGDEQVEQVQLADEPMSGEPCQKEINPEIGVPLRDEPRFMVRGTTNGIPCQMMSDSEVKVTSIGGPEMRVEGTINKTPRQMVVDTGFSIAVKRLEMVEHPKETYSKKTKKTLETLLSGETIGQRKKVLDLLGKILHGCIKGTEFHSEHKCTDQRSCAYAKAWVALFGTNRN